MQPENKKNNIELKTASDSQFSSLQETKEKSSKYKAANRTVVIAFIVLVALYIYSIAFYVVPTLNSHALAYILELSRTKFENFLAFLGGDSTHYSAGNIIRYTVIVISGAALATAGVVFQGSFRNIIASPTTMGVQSGAQLGNALYLLLAVSVTEGFTVIQSNNTVNQSLSFWELNKQQLFAMVGSFLAIVIVISITSAIGKGKFTSANILFGGMIFSSFTGAITSVIQYYFLYFDPDNSRATSMRLFSMGSFDRVLSVQQLIVISVIVIPCLIYMYGISQKLNLLVMGEDEAATMGVNVKFLRNSLIAVGTLMAATIFAFCGSIGFIGFIVPQISRRLVGPDFRRLMLMAMILGGIVMIFVYNIAFAIGFTAYLNVITSTIGCAMMAYSFVKGKGGAVVYE